jgi:hypothetical protein
MQVQGQFKMLAHNSSGVVMDIAAFKFSHSVVKDATALRAARAMSSSIGGDGGNVWARAEVEHTSGASLEYTLVLVSVAVPQMMSPPPCASHESKVSLH